MRGLRSGEKPASRDAAHTGIALIFYSLYSCRNPKSDGIPNRRVGYPVPEIIHQSRIGRIGDYNTVITIMRIESQIATTHQQQHAAAPTTVYRLRSCEL